MHALGLKEGHMGKWIRRVVVLAVAGVFLYSMASIGMTLYRYYISGSRL